MVTKLKKKFLEKIQNIKIKLKNLNQIYIDYFLCIAFLNIIISKLNQILFKIPPIYLYPIVILISIIFINQWIFLTNKIKDTYIFNWILYYFLAFKNFIYGFLFEYFNYLEYEKNQKLIIFFTGFVLSNWSLNMFFFILDNFFYNVSILVFFILLIINIFNLIEKKIIFNTENVNNYNNQQIDFVVVKSILKINNQKFNKNKSLFYIQKKYFSFKELQTLLKKHGTTLITSTTAGVAVATYQKYENNKIQRDQLEFQKDQFDKSMQFQKDQFELQKNHEREQLLLKYTDKIERLDEKIDNLQIDMNTRHFWNKVDFSKKIEKLKKEKDYLKQKRSFFNSEIKENSILNQKIKINDDNSLLDD